MLPRAEALPNPWTRAGDGATPPCASSPPAPAAVHRPTPDRRWRSPRRDRRSSCSRTRHPQPSLSGRHRGPPTPISAFARTAIGPRGGTCGTDSVSDSRPQELLVHNHFRFRRTIRGIPGPILMSRGRVLTQALDRDDRTEHRTGAVRTPIVRTWSRSTCTDSTTNTSESKQQGTTSLGHARAFASGCVENTQFTRARAPNQSPTRPNSVTPDPNQVGRAVKIEEPSNAGRFR